MLIIALEWSATSRAAHAFETSHGALPRAPPLERMPGFV